VEEQVISRIREELARYPESVHTLSRPMLFSFKTPIEVEIFAYDLEEQRIAANLIVERLSRIKGLEDIQTTTRLGNPEIQIRFDRQRLARLGLEDIGNLIINSPRAERENPGAPGQNGEGQGAGAGQGQGQGQGASQSQMALGGVGGFGQQPNAGLSAGARGTNAQVAPIRLSQVADITIARGPSEIHRVRSQRVALVSASLVGRDLNSVSDDIRKALAELRPQLPANVVAGLGGQNEELEVSYNSLMFALGLATFLVYLVMASQFESLIHPFIILFTVPLALVGVVYALWLTNTTVSVVVLLGVIILVGIVVNNAIVLIDYANQLRAEGRSKREALIEAGGVRLRPIMMTTLTTLLGLLPMAIGWGEGAEVRAPMAIAVIGGLTFSTILTLVLIPVAYEWADRKEFAADRLARNQAEGEASWQGAD
jgi:HAE1 family hydrophobic/amphiphilic exporter-1